MQKQKQEQKQRYLKLHCIHSPNCARKCGYATLYQLILHQCGGHHVATTPAVWQNVKLQLPYAPTNIQLRGEWTSIVAEHTTFYGRKMRALRRRDNGVCVQQHMQMPAPTNNISNMQRQAGATREIKAASSQQAAARSNCNVALACQEMDMQWPGGTTFVSFAYARHGVGCAHA